MRKALLYLSSLSLWRTFLTYPLCSSLTSSPLPSSSSRSLHSPFPGSSLTSVSNFLYHEQNMHLLTCYWYDEQTYRSAAPQASISSCRCGCASSMYVSVPSMNQLHLQEWMLTEPCMYECSFLFLLICFIVCSQPVVEFPSSAINLLVILAIPSLPDLWVLLRVKCSERSGPQS